jgi:predicted nucleic acid-binding Zn ribbon protein
MPLFDFKCTKCGHVDEHLVSTGQVEAGITFLCSKCEGVSNRDTNPTAPNTIFKGTGFPGNDWKRRPGGPKSDSR